MRKDCYIAYLTNSLCRHRMCGMSDVAIITPKRITRRKSTVTTPAGSPTVTYSAAVSTKAVSSVIDAFVKIIDELKKAQHDFEKLQLEIAETRDSWKREQHLHV